MMRLATTSLMMISRTTMSRATMNRAANSRKVAQDARQRLRLSHARLPLRIHPLIQDETGEPTENDPVRLPQSQERRASPSVLPDRQSISEPKLEDATLPSQYRSSPSAASKRGVETQRRSGSSALSQPRDHHGDRNQTNDPKQGDAQLPGGRGEQGVGSSVAASPVQEDGASIPQSSAAMSNNDRVLADVGPSVRPSASQDPLGLQKSLGRRPRSGTDVGENHRPVDDGVREHDRGDVTGPQPKRRRISTSTPAVGETAPKRQADPHRASPRSQRTRRPTTRVVGKNCDIGGTGSRPNAFGGEDGLKPV